MKIHEIPGKLSVLWNAEARAIVDSWQNYTITSEQFRDAVLAKGVAFAQKNGGLAWIVDSTHAKGLFTQEQLRIIDQEIFPKFQQIGIRYFITIKPTSSAFTLYTVQKYSSLTGSHGLTHLEASSLEQAVEWLVKELASVPLSQ